MTTAPGHGRVAPVQRGRLAEQADQPRQVWGYVEREYLLSGESNVYDWSPNGNYELTSDTGGSWS